MIKQIWLNLPVKDVARSQRFYEQMGFQLNASYHHNEYSTSFLIGINQVVLMLFSQNSFSTFSGQKVSNTAEGCEVLFSIDAESREEVDALANTVAAAGGSIFSKPAEVQGWMYGMGFCDPDGHRWNVLYMDFDRMPR